MTDQEKLIQLIATGEQCNIDLGVYQWLAQGFDKTELVFEIVNIHKVNKWFGVRVFEMEYWNLRAFSGNEEFGHLVLFYQEIEKEKILIESYFDLLITLVRFISYIIDQIELAVPE